MIREGYFVCSQQTRRLIRTALLVLAGALWIRPSVGETPIYRSEPSSQFLQDWLLCGPLPLETPPPNDPEVRHLVGFETDFLASIGGESNPTVSEGGKISHQGTEVEWVRHHAEDHIVDLDGAISTQSHVVGYGYCEMESPGPQVCLLSLGTNDGYRLWLNGEQIGDYPSGRNLSADDEIVPVRLVSGKNRILLKVEERGNKWGFCMRVLPFEANSFAERFPLFNVISREDGKAVLRLEQPAWLAPELLKSAAVSVTREGDPNTVIRRMDWNQEHEMDLGLDPTQYGRFVAHVAGEKKAGGEWETDIRFVAGKRVVHTLFADGKTDYSIVVGENASESEKWAASELSHWLAESGGAEFPVRSDSEPAAEREIVIGDNRHSEALLGPNDTRFQEADETFEYRNAGPSVLIRGGRNRGTMYGVMAFLENELGCRWYSPRVSAIPKRERFSFESLHRRESPGIRVRNDFYFEAFDPTWAARNRVNGAMWDREQPGGVEAYWSVHTFFPLLPPEEFFAEHPEYYSLIDGKRTHDHAQLCLTNPDVLRLLTERLKKVMRENPGYLIYSVSQNDWYGPCQCNHCQAIAKREESESGPVIAFVNQVAEAVEQEFPDKYIGTLAYQYTRKPCKTLRPRANVVIRLCSIECCFAHDFGSCEENTSFLADLEGWAEIAPHLYIWDYVVNFSHYVLPHPNFKVLQSNIRTFRDHKAIGIMEQAAYQSRGGEFAELRAYVLSKLLWDPECDVESVIQDFMFGYYGRSGQSVRQYFDLLHGRITPETHIHIRVEPDDKIYSDEFLRAAEAIFDEAERVADNDEVRRRVEMARFPVMYLKCRRSPSEAKRDGTYARLCEIAEREEITHYAEVGAPHKAAFHLGLETIE